MEKMISSLEEFFNKNKKYHKLEELVKCLNVKGKCEIELLLSALNSMLENGEIFLDKKLGYKAFPTTSGYAFGQLEVTKSGTGFVHTTDGNTILIENCDLNGALNGDNVVVYNIFNKRKDYFCGQIYKIAKRNNGKIVFEVIKNENSINFIPYNKNEWINIDIDGCSFKNLIDGDLILVNVGCESRDGIFKGEILNIIGHKDDPDVDIKLICEKNGINVDFSEDILKEVQKIPTEVSEKDILNRRDLRGENIFTIDCDKTKDRDDSVGIKKLDNGNYLLKVNIAHVSYYIKPYMKSFKEALVRCSSHYPGNTCIPMLHHIVSNGICSLNPNVDRLTKTVEMEINNFGDVINYEIYDSVINSRMAMSYSNVNKVLKGDVIPSYEDYIEDLKLMKELSDILNISKEKRNYINFKTLEEEIIENEKKEIIGFEKNNYGIAGDIIENFMLLANVTFYSHYSWFVLGYRVHDYPKEDKVKEIIKILRNSNIKLPKIRNVSAKSLKSIIDNLENSEISDIVNEWLLRSMEKARYDIINTGHFALQYDTYGHFTSPIRRIMDLITQMTADWIESMSYNEKCFNTYEKFVDNACKCANKVEEIDKLIEKETIEMLMAKYMEDKIGNEYEAYITDIGPHSMIVRTTELIKGKVKIEDILDDKYYYDYDRNAIVGRNTKTRYQIGSKTIVVVKDASKSTRTINFEIPKQKKLTKMP